MHKYAKHPRNDPKAAVLGRCDPFRSKKSKKYKTSDITDAAKPDGLEN